MFSTEFFILEVPKFLKTGVLLHLLKYAVEGKDENHLSFLDFWISLEEDKIYQLWKVFLLFQQLDCYIRSKISNKNLGHFLRAINPLSNGSLARFCGTRPNIFLFHLGQFYAATNDRIDSECKSRDNYLSQYSIDESRVWRKTGCSFIAVVERAFALYIWRQGGQNRNVLKRTTKMFEICLTSHLGRRQVCPRATLSIKLTVCCCTAELRRGGIFFAITVYTQNCNKYCTLCFAANSSI